VALLRTDVSENRNASIISVTRIGVLETKLAVNSNRRRQRNIPEDGILHSHRSKNLKSYIALTDWALQGRCNVFSVRYELGFYIQEGGILHRHHHGNLISEIVLTG
jgi:hypothetical protein